MKIETNIVVVGYLRVSGAGQVEGDGLVRQDKSVTDFCKEHGLHLLKSFREEGVTGTLEAMDRPEFAKLVEYADSLRGTGGAVGAIVVERMDRLARDLMVSEFLLAECRKRGLKVFSVDQGTLIDMADDKCDPTRVLIRQIMGALAQWEKSVIVAKLRKARERKKIETGRCEGNKPYGTLRNERTILTVLLDFARDGWSARQIAEYLNSAGFSNRAGRPWTRSYVTNLVKDHAHELNRQDSSPNGE